MASFDLIYGIIWKTKHNKTSLFFIKRPMNTIAYFVNTSQLVLSPMALSALPLSHIPSLYCHIHSPVTVIILALSHKYLPCSVS